MKRNFLVVILILSLSLPLFSQYSFDSTYERSIKNIYLNKNFTLLIPLYVYDTKLSNSILSVLKYGGKPIFTPGEIVTIVSVDFKNSEITFKFYSFDRKKKGTIRIKRPISKESLGHLLSKIFFRGKVKNPEAKFIENLYDQLFIKMSNSLSIKERKLEKLIIKNFSTYEELSSKLKEKEYEIKLLNKKIKKYISENKSEKKENRNLKAEIEKLREELSGLREKTNSILKSKGDTERLVEKVIDYKKKLDEKIREIAISLGVNEKDIKSIDLLSKIENNIMNMSISNKTMKAKIDEDIKKISELKGELENLKDKIKNLEMENKKLKKKIKILSTSDKKLAGKLISIEHEKNIFQSKLLSKKIIKITQKKVVEGDFQKITGNIFFKDIPMGTLTIKAPIFISKGKKCKIFGVLKIKSNIRNKTFKKLCRYIKNFPDILLSMKKIRGKVDVKLIQSPENSNSNTYIWEISSNEPLNDIFLTIRGELISIDREKIPIFQIPVTIKPLSLEKTIVSYLQPIPLGIGIIIGLLIALPFLIKVRKKTKKREKSLYFGDKEI